MTLRLTYSLMMMWGLAEAQDLPRFLPSGVVSAADGSPANFGVAPGSLLLIQGENFVEAQTRVRFRSAARAIDVSPLSVSATEIKAIAPRELPLEPVSLTVLTPAGESSRIDIPIVRSRFTAFTPTRQPFGPAVVQQHRASGMTLNRLGDPSLPGDVLVLWGTGLGDAGDVTVWMQGVPVKPLYAGPAPTLPGVDQINFRRPDELPNRCFLPVQVRAGERDSVPYTLTTSSTAGPCASSEMFRSGGTVTLRVFLRQIEGDRQFVEAWVGEYDAAHLSVFEAGEFEPAIAGVTCVRRAAAYMPAEKPLGLFGLTPAMYGLSRRDFDWEVTITGPNGCTWPPLTRSNDGVYRTSAPPGCPANDIHFSNMGADLTEAPAPSVEAVRMPDGSAALNWNKHTAGRLFVDLSSTYTITGTIFYGLTNHRESNCALTGVEGAGSISSEELNWAFSLPTSHSATVRLVTTVGWYDTPAFQSTSSLVSRTNIVRRWPLAIPPVTAP